MKILYVINSPCWTEISPSGLNNSNMFSNELSENFTFFYYNLMKFGLVEKVIIFVEEKRWRIDKNIKKKIITEYGTLEIRKDTKKFKVINSDDQMNFVFCWSNIEECNKINKKFVIVDNQFHGYINKSSINKKFHDLVLTESENFKKYIPKAMPTCVYKLTSYDHENFELKNNNNAKIKKYDWLMVSSFDKRKRHIEFLNSLKNSNLSFSKGVYISTDYTGFNFPDATWVELEGNIANSSWDSFEWENSGNILLPVEAGKTGYVAFQYTGSGADNGNGETSTYGIDNVVVEAQ